MQQSVRSGDREGLSKQNLNKITSDGIHPRFSKYIIIVKVITGLALLTVSVWGIRFENLLTGIRTANLTWMGLSILLVLFGLALKLWRWGLLIKNYHIQASPARIFSAYFVGQAANILLPVRGGELVRMSYFAMEKEILPQAITTVILEKYLDLLALTLCVILVSFKISVENILNVRKILLPLAIVLTLSLLCAMFLGPLVWEKMRGRKQLPQQLIHWLDKWIEASHWLRNPMQVIPGVVLTIFIWGVMWLTNLVLFKGLDLPQSGTAAGLVLVLVYIGLMPALMPANIGPFYFFARLALLSIGITDEKSIVFAVILHAIVTLPPLFLGAVGLMIPSKRPESL